MAFATQGTFRWQHQKGSDGSTGCTTNPSQRCPCPHGERRCCPHQQPDPGLVSSIGCRQSQRPAVAPGRESAAAAKHAHSRGPASASGCRSSSRPSNKRTTKKSTISSNESGRVYQAGIGAAMVAPASARPVRLRRWIRLKAFPGSNHQGTALLDASAQRSIRSAAIPAWIRPTVPMLQGT